MNLLMITQKTVKITVKTVKYAMLKCTVQSINLVRTLFLENRV